MERKSKKSATPKVKDNGPQKPLWKKITRGTLYPFPNQRNRRVKPNETIQAAESEIEKYRDQFELVKDGTGFFKVKPVPVKVVPQSTPEKETYDLAPVGDGKYNVLSSSGKAMNESFLDLEEAEALKESLEEESEED